MEKTKVELVLQEPNITDAIVFSLAQIKNNEKNNYDALKFDSVMAEIKELDAFDPVMLLKNISTGDVVLYTVKSNNEIILTSAMNRTNSRILFWITNGEDKTAFMSKKLLNHFINLCDKSEPLTILAFLSQVKFLESLGFKKIKSMVNFKSILLVPMRFTVDQYDNENY